MVLQFNHSQQTNQSPINLTVCLTDDNSYAVLTIVDSNDDYIAEIDICFYCESFLENMSKAIEEFHDYLKRWAATNYPFENVCFNVEDEIYQTTFETSFWENQD